MQKIKISPLWVWLLAFGWLAFNLGISDDEAYYWKLAQTPAWGYAFHPPVIAWVIAFFQKLTSPFFGSASPFALRIPALLVGCLLIWQISDWLKKLGADPVRARSSGWVFISFAGMFGALWMMVPDVPMLLGWILLFRSSWNWTQNKKTVWTLVGMVFGSVLAIQSKYTGILFWGSAILAVFFEARQRLFKDPGFWALMLGLVLALVPIFIFNEQNDWGPFRYQFIDRHSGFNFNLTRWFRFVFLQFVLAGPLVLYSLKWFFKVRIHKVPFFLSLWFWPPFLVFTLQPLFSDFKFHWSLTAWLPAAVLMAWRSCQQMDQGWMKAQRRYAAVLMAVVWIGFQFPIFSVLGRSVLGDRWDPRFDIGNDYFGWSHFYETQYSKLTSEEQKFVVVGSRYQTASQAAFAINLPDKVILVPQDQKQMGEWPKVDAFSSEPNLWPELKQSVLFVADNRYGSKPEFKNSKCSLLNQFWYERFSINAKRIDLYRCDPN